MLVRGMMPAVFWGLGGRRRAELTPRIGAGVEEGRGLGVLVGDVLRDSAVYIRSSNW